MPSYWEKGKDKMLNNHPPLYPSQSSRMEHFHRNVTLGGATAERDVGIEKGIKITIRTCPAAQLKLLGCYMPLFAISCPGRGMLIMELFLASGFPRAGQIGIEGLYMWLYWLKWAGGLGGWLLFPRTVSFAVQWRWLPSCFQHLSDSSSSRAHQDGFLTMTTMKGEITKTLQVSSVEGGPGRTLLPCYSSQNGNEMDLFFSPPCKQTTAGMRNRPMASLSQNGLPTSKWDRSAQRRQG